MRLQECINAIIESQGSDILRNILIVDVLDNHNAFTNKPSAKNILKNIISEGIMDKLLFIHNNGLDLSNNIPQYINELYENYGFSKDVIIYVFFSILNGLGYKTTDIDNLNDIRKNSSDITPNETRHLSFLGIEINGTQNEICSKLSMSGFSKTMDLEDGNIVMSGKYANIDDCNIFILKPRYDKHVYEIIVFLPERDNWDRVKYDYNQIKDILTKEYGIPDFKETFTYPFQEGDGTELKALLTGNCNYYSYYKTSSGKISLTIAKEGYVVIGYEDKINAKLNSDELLEYFLLYCESLYTNIISLQ